MDWAPKLPQGTPAQAIARARPRIEPLHVAAYVEALGKDFEKPTVKQHLAGVCQTGLYKEWLAESRRRFGVACLSLLPEASTRFVRPRQRRPEEGRLQDERRDDRAPVASSARPR